ncbi:Fic/DOC family protein [Acidisoma sp. 7E03]
MNGAGHTRDERVKLSDGSIATEPLLLRPGSKPFASGAQISEGLEALSQQLRDVGYLRGLPRREFVTRAAGVLATINGIHAFRERNGRTQRIFLQELAEEAGHKLDFRAVSRERMIQASIAAHEERDIGPMRRMLDEISNPHRVAALTPAIAFLNSMKYPWNERYLATTEPGHTEAITAIGMNGPHFMARTDSIILVGQRADLPKSDMASGENAKVFATPWPEPGDDADRSPQSRPAPAPDACCAPAPEGRKQSKRECSAACAPGAARVAGLRPRARLRRLKPLPRHAQMRPAGGVFGQEDPGRKAAMRKTAEIVWIATSAVPFAIAIFVVLAAPGFLSDASSTVPIVQSTGAQR